MDTKPPILIIGAGDTRLWGLTGGERIARIAAARGLMADALTSGRPTADGSTADGAAPAVLANAAYAFDPAWLDHVVEAPGTVVTLAGVPVLGHAAQPADAGALAAAMRAGAPLPGGTGLTAIAQESAGSLANRKLRKRERPFMGVLEPAAVPALERASYFGAYKGVTDILTKYLWPEWALVLTRIAARIGMTPNQVTSIGALLCVAATILFWFGHYWAGLAAGLVFMVLDTVDGKLARCTITSSEIGNVFDHGIDIVHPPFWWYAWGVGLAAWGLPLTPQAFWWVMGLIWGGYIVQRLIEGAFIRLFGFHIHVWRRFDSQFRLVTARRNPNMVILFASLIVQRPDLGIVAVAGWTVASLVVHMVQLAEALWRRPRGARLESWIA